MNKAILLDKTITFIRTIQVLLLNGYKERDGQIYKIKVHNSHRLIHVIFTSISVNSLLKRAVVVMVRDNIVGSNRVHGEVYSIQHYVIKFVKDLRYDGGFLRVLRFTPPIKLTATI